MRLQLNTSLKHHFFIAIAISLWLVLFLVLIAPFDISDLDFEERLQILPPYGIICFLNYMLLVPIQNFVFKTLKKWTIVFEVLFIVVFNSIQIKACYAYYRTEWVNGEYDFWTWSAYIYIPISLVLLSVIIFLRWFFNKKAPQKKESLLTLKGDNKLDILKILPDDIVCISSADNYVEVNYLRNGKLNKKLLRNTLKNIQNDVPNLFKVHRSHLINLSHFIEWNDSSSVKLTETEVPVSKNYKSKLITAIQSSQKQDHLSQSQ
ncbi:MAG: LytTR family transcriptional regulator [Winogradskyella sp.]|uniref:LytR/AlgR family response regulator transcription factor n=1 Tax=Winogradskyella sp. TaxID=1883156 RepID=UPI000F3AB1B5|nr:LytTR family DNA-binding domain-containing protein [Winogradskyella sp.]RNC86767.1 MAG: LytTR family transcriptional regulator [Winogradskyella sp.]